MRLQPHTVLAYNSQSYNSPVFSGNIDITQKQTKRPKSLSSSKLVNDGNPFELPRYESYDFLMGLVDIERELRFDEFCKALFFL